MNRRIVLVAVLLALIAGAAFWWLKGSHGGTAAGPDAAPESTADLLAKKRAARHDQPVDQTPARLSGIVTASAGGKGIAGAVVALSRRGMDAMNGGGGGGGGDDDRPVTYTTGADGRFSAADVAPGSYTVSAAAEGYLPGAREITLVPGGDGSVELALDAGGSLLSGVVSDVSGGAIGGAVVGAASLDDLFGGGKGSATAITKDDGTYRLSVRDGDYFVSIWHPEYAPTQRRVSVRGATTADFALMPGGSIQGQVVTRDKEEPVPGALVMQHSGGTGGFGFSGMGTAADAEGKFTLRGLKPGEVSLSAVAKGFGSATPTVVDLGLGEEVSGVRVYVDKAFTVSGFVVEKDRHAQGVPGVLVGGFSLSGRTTAFASRPSEKDGYFQIDGVRPGNYMVFAFGEGVVPSMMQTTFTVKDKDVDDVLVELDRGVTVAGRVEPPEAASIGLELEGDVGFGNMMSAVSAGMVKGVSNPSTGEFELKAVPSGKFKIVAKTTAGKKGSLPIEVAGAPLTGLVVRLEDRGAISGTVVDDTGKPVTGVRVVTKKLGQSKANAMNFDFGELLAGGAMTGAGGAFKAVGLDAGKYGLTVRDERGQLAFADPAAAKKPFEVEVVGDEEVKDVRLVVESRSGVIRGVVVGAGGAPVPDAFVTAALERPNAKPGGTQMDAEQGGGGHGSVSVSISVGGGDDDTKGADMDDAAAAAIDGLDARNAPPTLTDDDGRFTIANLRQGAYTVTAEGLKDAGRATKTGVRPDADIRLELKSLGTIAGTVTSGGKPVADYTLTIKGPTERTTRVIQAEGRFSERRLDPGEYTVSVRADAGTASGKATLASGQTATVDLVLAGFGTLTGTLVDARTGKPLSGMKVIVVSGDSFDEDQAMGLIGGAGGVSTDSSGRFQAGRVAPGKGQVGFLSGMLTGFAAVGSKSFTIAAEQTLDLGVIKGLTPPDKVKDQGTYGLDYSTTTWAKRPGAVPGKGPPAGLDADTEYLWVAAVTPGGPAAAAGLKPGDRILAVDGLMSPEIDADALGQLLDESYVAPGQTTKLTMDRGEVTLTAVPYTPPTTP